jgi:hypothetical protein
MARPPGHRPEPRLSAAQLADYLAATSQLAQFGILRGAKYPGEARPLIIQYQQARRCIAACLITPENTNRLAAAAIADLEQRRDDPANRPLVRDDARRSIEAIQTFQRSVNALDLRNVRFVASPRDSQPLMINGVEVSVSSDALSFTNHRDGDRVGQLFVRCAIGGEGDAAENRRADANQHLATIAHMHTSEYLTARGTPHSPTSVVVDVMRGRAYRGPVSTTLRVRNIEAACRMISAIWADI